MSYISPTYGDYGADALLSSSLPDTYRADTAEFQRLLVAAGYGSYLGSKGADGFFGTGTTRAVQAYQGGNALPVTGVADQATWNALRGKNTGTTTSPAKTGTSWQDNLGVFASSLGEGIANTFSGKDAAATQDGPPVGGYVPPKKSVMPWVFGGFGLLVIAGGVFYYVNNKSTTSTKSRKGKK
jgi:hypothetical protein